MNKNTNKISHSAWVREGSKYVWKMGIEAVWFHGFDEQAQTSQIAEQ
jgi:hypothetical protein